MEGFDVTAESGSAGCYSRGSLDEGEELICQLDGVEFSEGGERRRCWAPILQVGWMVCAFLRGGQLR
jgi:hypothetical protein